MKVVLCLGLFFVLVACGELPNVPSKPGVPSEPTNTPSNTPPSPDLQSLLALVNDVRAKGYDCGSEGKFSATKPLMMHASLTTAAQKHSADLDAAKTKTNMHVTPAGAINYTPGMTFTQRVDTEGYEWALVGENVAYNFATPELVMKAWLASPGHCKNIMNASYTDIGLGKAGAYWTQVFASPL